jgi:hypothetical protein
LARLPHLYGALDVHVDDSGCDPAAVHVVRMYILGCVPPGDVARLLPSTAVVTDSLAGTGFPINPGRSTQELTQPSQRSSNREAAAEQVREQSF